MSSDHSIVDLGPAPSVEYRDVSEFPGYRVGSDGSVWTRWERFYPRGISRAGVRYVLGEHWKPLKARPINKYGYLEVQLYKDGLRYHRLVHRLVLEAFIGLCPEGMECRHLDGKPGNCWLDNLAWATPKVNQGDRPRHGTDVRGEKHGIAAVTNQQAVEIRRMAETCKNKSLIARRFHTTRYVVAGILRGETYRDAR
jgi:hypothetical protein